jgi:hypothetical protein
MSFFRGRLQRIYLSRLLQNKGVHLPWGEVESLLDELVAGSSSTDFELYKNIATFSLALACVDPTNHEVRSLAQGLSDLDLAMSQSPIEIPERLKCFFLFSAYPTTLRHHIRYDTRDGKTIEWQDYTAMKTRILTTAGIFHEHVRSAYLPGLKRKSNDDEYEREPVKKKTYVNALAGVPPPPSTPSPASGWRTPASARSAFRAHEVPMAERRAVAREGDTYWIRDFRTSARNELVARKICFLCKAGNHSVYECPEAREKFQKGDFFFYSRSLKM